MDSHRTDLAVGLTVIAALGLLFASSFRLGSCTGVARPGTRLVAHFGDAAGLAPRTEVAIAGVQVGEIEAVSLDGGRARLTLRIDEGVPVPVDSTVAVRSRGLLGERALEIVQGASEQLHEDGGVLVHSVEAPDLDGLIADLGAVATDLRGVTRSVRHVLGGEDGEEAIAAVVEDVRVAAAGLRRFVEEDGARLGSMLESFDAAAADVAALTRDVSRAAEEEGETVGAMLDNFARASATLSSAVDDLAVVSARVEQGEGTLGKLVKDEALYERVDASVEELQRTLEEVRRAAEDAQEQLPVTVLGSLVGSLF